MTDDDALTVALPLMRRMLEAHYRTTDTTAEDAVLAAARYEGARDALYRYLVAHGWTPPNAAAAEGPTTVTLIDVSAVGH